MSSSAHGEMGTPFVNVAVRFLDWLDSDNVKNQVANHHFSDWIMPNRWLLPLEINH